MVVSDKNLRVGMKQFKKIFKAKRFGFYIGGIKGASHADYKYQGTAIKSVPTLVVVLLGGFAFAFSVVWFRVFGSMWESWQGVENLFSLVGSLFLTFWLIAWSMMTFFLILIFISCAFSGKTVLVHSGKMEIIVGVLGIGFIIRLKANEVIRSYLTSNKQIQIETDDDGQEQNSPFGQNMTKHELEKFQYAVEKNYHIESGLGDWPELDMPRQLKPETEGHNFLDSSVNSEPLQSDELGLQVTLTSLSTQMLILANLIPLFGVVFLGWDLGNTMVLYWAETIIILFYMLCKNFVRYGWVRLFFSIFSVAPLGAFIALHFLFVWTIFVEDLSGASPFQSNNLSLVSEYLVNLWPALLGLMVSHGVSFKLNFLDKLTVIHKGGENKKLSEFDSDNVYSRIIIMHLTLIVGGWLILLLGSGVYALSFLILLKIVVDVRAHLKLYQK